MRTLLMYPPLQFAQGAVAKPDGSLGLPYLAGALRRAGHEVDILDAAVDGGAFTRVEPLPSGLVRVGMSDDAVARVAGRYDVVGVTSIFTAQTTMALAAVRAVRRAHPDTLIVAGGGNARCLAPRFFDAGVDLIVVGEGEATLVQVVERAALFCDVRVDRFSDIPGLLLPGGVFTGPPVVTQDLDELPVPAWDLLPLLWYWGIGRPHGGGIPGVSRPRYAEVMTSRGCPFACSFCHISEEKKVDPRTPQTGEIGRYRVKSDARVLRELEALRTLEVEWVYVEDDSFLAQKARALRLLRAARGLGLQFADVNGVNVAHLFRNAAGRLEPDVELLGALVEAGFRELSLPFESGSQRVLDAWAARKWSLARMDTGALVRAAVAVGLRVSGNYMLGFPDETVGEVMQTVGLAAAHRDAGLAEANVFCVVPFPGSRLFDYALRYGHLAPDFDPDAMLWFRPVMRGTTVPAEQLQVLRDAAWRALNSREFVAAQERRAVGVS